MTEKKLFYETPQSELCTELLLDAGCLVASAEDHFIDDAEPYFDSIS